MTEIMSHLQNFRYTTECQIIISYTENLFVSIYKHSS